MSADGGHMAEVQLVAEDLDDDSRAPRSPRPARRRRSWVLAAVLVLATGAAVVHELRTTRAETLVLAQVAPPAAAPSLREPVGELWRAEGRVVGGGEGVVLLAEADPAAGTVLRGHAAGTGDLLWSHELGYARPSCPVALRPFVICEVRPSPAERADDGLLWAVDPRDGSVHARRTLDARASWDLLDGDLVLAQQVGRGLRVSREALTGSVVRWSTVLPLPDGVTAAQVDLRVGDGLVALAGGTGAVLTAEGDVLGQWPRGSRSAVVVRTDADGFAVWTEHGEGRWYDRAGHPGVRLPGEPVPVPQGAVGGRPGPFVGDARAGMPEGLLLVRTPGGIAVADVRGRGLLWSRGAPRRTEVIVVAGAAVLVSGERVRVVDLVDGATTWRADRGAGTDAGHVLTDGLRVLVPGHEADLGRSATVRTLTDGRVVWTAALPADATALEAAPGGVLVAAVRGGVVVVGP